MRPRYSDYTLHPSASAGEEGAYQSAQGAQASRSALGNRPVSDLGQRKGWVMMAAVSGWGLLREYNSHANT